MRLPNLSENPEGGTEDKLVLQLQKLKKSILSIIQMVFDHQYAHIIPPPVLCSPDFHSGAQVNDFLHLQGGKGGQIVHATGGAL